eukprot:9715150-Alexandrium_andersonii.AAC.1
MSTQPLASRKLWRRTSLRVRGPGRLRERSGGGRRHRHRRCQRSAAGDAVGARASKCRMLGT